VQAVPAAAKPTHPIESPLYRLRNLYSCRQEGTGKAVKFVPRPEQEAVFKHLVERPRVPLYIVKSRRLGISTAVDTFEADGAVFSRGWRGLIIDQDQGEATKKMVEIVRFAVDSLPKELLGHYEFNKRNDSELRLRVHGEEESQDSVVFAGISGRGGDCTMLHVSEWGPIAATDPQRSTEIRTGTFPSARLGRRVVETTWYGGKVGDLWDLIKPLLERDPNAEGEIMFFPWHNDPEAIRLDGMVTREVEDYFRTLAGRLGKGFSAEQKQWYAAKKVEQGLFIKREYPSTLEEALEAPVQGTIYGLLLTQLQVAGKIYDFEYDRAFPVYASWDIGWDDSTAVWFWQLRGNRVDWVRYIEARHATAADMANAIRATGIPVAAHYLPHDCGATHAETGSNYVQELTKAGLLHLKPVRQTRDLWIGINQLCDLLPRSQFAKTACAEGIEKLEAYHTKTLAGNVTSAEPVHDASSHCCLIAGTLVTCEQGDIPIERIKKGWKVRLGSTAAQVQWAGYVKDSVTIAFQLSNGSQLECTPEHRIFTTKGVICADSICVGQVFVTSFHPCINHLSTSTAGIRAGFSDYIEEGAIGIGQIGDTTFVSRVIGKISSIFACGQTIMARFQQDLWSGLRVAGGIFNHWSYGRIIHERSGEGPWFISKESRSIERPGRNISGPLQARGNMRADLFTGSFGNTTMEQSRSVGMSIIRMRIPRIIVSKILRLCHRVITPNCTRNRVIGSAVLPIRSNSQNKRDSLVCVVGVSRRRSSTPVYDLTVQHHHCYLANGILVSNSDAARIAAEAINEGMVSDSSMTSKEAARKLRRPLDTLATSGFRL
jgi:hypothetical protein